METQQIVRPMVVTELLAKLTRVRFFKCLGDKAVVGGTGGRRFQGDERPDLAPLVCSVCWSPMLS